MKNEIDVIGRLLANTGRQKRSVSLLEIADDISWLVKNIGSLSKVAELVDISTGMLNKFLSVNTLTDEIKELIHDRKIDSVELVNKMAKFSLTDQRWIAQQVIDGNLNSIDVRILSPLKKQYPSLSIEEAFKKLNDSQDRRVSTIKFSPEDMKRSVDELQSIIVEIVGKEELLDLKVDQSQGYITITPKGEKELRKAAKGQHKTLQDFTYAIMQ